MDTPCERCERRVWTPAPSTRGARGPFTTPSHVRSTMPEISHGCGDRMNAATLRRCLVGIVAASLLIAIALRAPLVSILLVGLLLLCPLLMWMPVRHERRHLTRSEHRHG
jgi:Flp pilus assembly protein TadB